MHQPKTIIPNDLQDKVYSLFCNLELEDKLVIYARLAHGNMFKAQNNDLFGLNRRTVSKIYRAFIISVRENCEDRANTTHRKNSRGRSS